MCRHRGQDRAEACRGQPQHPSRANISLGPSLSRWAVQASADVWASRLPFLRKLELVVAYFGVSACMHASAGSFKPLLLCNADTAAAAWCMMLHAMAACMTHLFIQQRSSSTSSSSTRAFGRGMHASGRAGGGRGGGVDGGVAPPPPSPCFFSPQVRKCATHFVSLGFFCTLVPLTVFTPEVGSTACLHSRDCPAQHRLQAGLLVRAAQPAAPPHVRRRCLWRCPSNAVLCCCSPNLPHDPCCRRCTSQPGRWCTSRWLSPSPPPGSQTRQAGARHTSASLHLC